METFYDRIKKIADEKDIKLTNLMKELKLSTSMPTNWKNGQLPAVDTLLLLSNYFDVSLDFLLKGKDHIKVNENKFEVKEHSNAISRSPNAQIYNTKNYFPTIKEKNNNPIETNNLKQDKTNTFVHILGKGSFGEYEFEVNTQCPMCHFEIMPQFVKAIVCGDRKDNIIVFYYCPHCGRVYAVSYTGIDKINQNTQFEQIWNIKNSHPLISCSNNYTPFLPPTKTLPSQFLDNKKDFPKTINAYNDAQLIEGYGITNFIGAAYRKVIDMLIHEFIVFSGKTFKEKDSLQKLINDNGLLYDEQTKELATAINKLGNDGLHYLNKHEDYDFTDILELFDALIDNLKRQITRKKALLISNERNIR